MATSEGTTIKGGNIEDRVHNAGLPALSVDQINSKKIRKTIYTSEAGANFALYGENDGVIMSYDIELDEGVKELIRRSTASLIDHRAKGMGIIFEDIEQIIKTANYHISIFSETSVTGINDETSFLWYEDPAKISGVRADRAAEHDSNLEYFRDIVETMEKEFHGKTVKDIQKTYGFTLMPVIKLNGKKTDINPIGLKVTYISVS